MNRTEILAQSLLEWVNGKEQPIDINLFPLMHAISLDNFSSLVKEDKQLGEAYNQAIDIISARIKRLWVSGKISEKFALAILPLYDKDFKDVQMKSINGEKRTEFITVMMPDFSCDLTQYNSKNK